MASVVEQQNETCQPIAIPSTPQKSQQIAQPDTPSTCPGTPSLLSSTLRSRISTLKEVAAKAPKPSVKQVWPGSGQPPMVSTCPRSDESLWEDILVKFGASGVPAAREALYFEEVIKAGMDANSVPFPQMQLRQGVGRTFSNREASAVQCQDSVPFPLLQPLAKLWTVDVADVEKEVVELMIAGRAKGHQELREAFYSKPPLDTELSPWTLLKDGIISVDECTDAQLLVWQQRSTRRPSLQRLEKRRECCNPRIFEEVRPELGQEAALLELRASRARDKATEARQHEELAEQGAAFVAWVVPNERRWPEPCAAWTHRGKWLKMWRARPIVASTFSFKPMQRSDSAASLSSWAAVSEVSWVDVESKASECGWDEVLSDQEPALAEADPAVYLNKHDITEIKAFPAPPVGVCLTMEVICILLEVQPIQLKDGGVNYWEPAKQLLGQASFLTQVSALRHYVSAKALNAAAPYMSDEEFTPEHIQKSSKAAAGLCRWAREIYKYHMVAMASAGAMRQQHARKPAPELLAEAQAALNTLQASAIQELKSLAKPPRGVDVVCSCLLYLLQGIAPSIELRKNGNAKASWQGSKKLMANPTGLLAQLNDFKDAIDAGTVPRRNIEMARKVQIDMGVSFTAEAMRCKSLAVAGLCAWINNIIAYYDLVCPKQLGSLVRQEAAAPKPDESFLVKACDIQELKSLSHPPQDVKEVLTAVCFLLNSEETCDWSQCQHMIANPNKFLSRLASFDAQKVSPAALTKAKAIAEQAFFNADALKAKAASVVGLSDWVLRAVGHPHKISTDASIVAAPFY